MANPRIYTIPASAPFLRTLIDALRAGRLIEGFPASRDPLALASATLYLPTRRACRLARDVFLEALDGGAAILPRIVPIGDIDEEEFVFADAAAGGIADEALALKPALDGLERQILLAPLVSQWAASMRPDRGSPLVANTPMTALALANDLARLMDDMTTREVSWDKLDGLVPDNLDIYWQRTLDFLKIARTQWPRILVEHDAVERAERSKRLIAAEAKRLAAASDGPVIAAGSTGSTPATAALLAVIAALPHGAVVLPGLDTELDQDSWEMIADAAEQPLSGHPQFALAGLLRRIGIARDAVRELTPPAPNGRELFVSEALRPAAATDQWQRRLAEKEFATRAKDALAGIAVVAAANAEEEALAIAVALREAVETPRKTAALITPDRALARRVLTALERWNVPVDDSGGDPLADTAAGVFARFVAEAAFGGVEPVTLLALLKHPLCRLDAPPQAHMRAASLLERAILRGPRPKPGTAGLAHALTTLKDKRAELHRADPRKELSDGELDAAAALVSKLAIALEPLERLAAREASVSAIAARHRKAIAALSSEETGTATAFSGWDGTALGAMLDEIAESKAAQGMAVARADYAEFFRGIAASRIVRRPGAPGSRVRIFGPLEARLQVADRVVLGGLVEGIWPPETRTDPWLSRQMRHALGLDLPERRIGLSAHDFAQALGAREIVLTYAGKLAGAPTVPSRFLQRLAAVAGEHWRAAMARGENYLSWARALDHPAAVNPAPRPRPKPPRAARPTQLSVTDIEHWLRDPYTIYAKHILNLVPLDPVDTPPGARDRGTVIHAAIGDFAKEYSNSLPADPAAALLTIGQKYFATLEDFPEARAFWWPRFKRIAQWFAGWERDRRANIAALHIETGGKLDIAAGERVFRLTARADRIERRADGSYAIVDFKTGAAPTEKQVRLGLAPQLTLEAAILRGGGFPGLPPGPVDALAYVEIKGGDPAGQDRPIEFKEGNAESQAERARAQLAVVASRFEDENTPYRSLVHPMWKTRYGDYDHLARIKEWSLSGGADDEAGGGE